MEEELRNAGLTGNEAKIYLELIKLGETSAYSLSRKISMDRTLSYTVLNHLIDKGLVSYVVKDRKKMFKATNPEHLLNPIKKKEILINDLIPKLKSLEPVQESFPSVEVYEGKAGLRTFMKEVMKHRSFCSFGATGRSYDLLLELPAVAKEMQKKGFSARIIAAPSVKKHPMTRLKNMSFRYVNLPAQATTTLFADTVAIHIAKEKPQIIIIKNKDIFSSYQNYFDFMWAQAKK